MEYVYTAPNCPRCDDLKEKLNKRGIEFFERVGYKEIFKDNNPKRIYYNMGLEK